MATKPTDHITWAESADPGDLAEPSAKRPGGWQQGDALPYNALNWLLWAIGRALTFVLAMFGANGRLQMDASNGGLAVTTDTATELVYELQHDAGTLVGKAGLVLDRLLARRSVRLAVDSSAEADGDLQLVGDNLIHDACGVLTIGTKPGHATLTSSGVVCQTLKPTLAEPGDADQRARFPRHEALYNGNLIKFTAQVEITYDGSGVPSITSASGYNLDTTDDAPELVDAEGGVWPQRGLRLWALDGAPNTYTATVGFDSGDALVPALVHVTPTLDGVRLSVSSWSGSGWTDALASGSDTAKLILHIVGL